jgi:signal peptidase II
MKRWPRILLVLITVIACVGCDQTAKAVAERHLKQTRFVSLAGDTLRLHYTENRGGFLSLGAALSPAARTWIFIVAVGAALALLLAYLTLGSAYRPGTMALALIAGGGMSNLIDRLMHDGVVVDFLNVGLGSMRTGIFNLADVAIMAGVAMLLFRRSSHQNRRAA